MKTIFVKKVEKESSDESSEGEDGVEILEEPVKPIKEHTLKIFKLHDNPHIANGPETNVFIKYIFVLRNQQKDTNFFFISIHLPLSC